MLKVIFKYKLKTSGQIRTKSVKFQSEQSFKTYFDKRYGKYCELVSYLAIEEGVQLKMKF